ncbi:MAG: uracil-DNA glycosylase family protein [Roseiarcus sp.]
MDPSFASLAALADDIRACRVCRDAPRYGAPLPHEPRPVFQISPSARLCIAGQAPGVRVHASGRPYTDPSGVRLRGWLGIGEETFYDPEKVAIVPMGFCFPGLDAKGGDLPPRRECAEMWRERLMARLPNLELILLVGQYAQRWRLGASAVARGLSDTVGRWRAVYCSTDHPRLIPLPHPSWRNNAWLKRNPWFETELLPVLRTEAARAVAPAPRL